MPQAAAKNIYNPQTIHGHEKTNKQRLDNVQLGLANTRLIWSGASQDNQMLLDGLTWTWKLWSESRGYNFGRPVSLEITSTAGDMPRQSDSKTKKYDAMQNYKYEVVIIRKL